MNIGALTQTVAAVAPIDGISIGIVEDRETWRIDFQLQATQEQRDAAHAALLAWVEPSAPRNILWLDFLGLFTPTELATIVNSADQTVKLYIFMAAGNGGTIDLADQRTQAGFDVLIGAGLLTADRKTRILAGLPPE